MADPAAAVDAAIAEAALAGAPMTALEAQRVLMGALLRLIEAPAGTPVSILLPAPKDCTVFMTEAITVLAKVVMDLKGRDGAQQWARQWIEYLATDPPGW